MAKQGLKSGYTTGSCATAAAKCAAMFLTGGVEPKAVNIELPGGGALTIPVHRVERNQEEAVCSVIKDAGDDPDSTHGIEIEAKVSLLDSGQIVISGGKGIGVVTKKGLDQPVGAHAINSVPREMIRKNLEEIKKRTQTEKGFHVIVSAVNGEEVAKKTFNPLIGIEGGISVIGTTGIVEPMSEKALIDSIRVEMKVARENYGASLLVMPGNYGKQFAKNILHIDTSHSIKSSNFFKETLEYVKELNFEKVLIVGHIGKMIKLAGGIMNTHSAHADARMEILAAYASKTGGDSSLAGEILGSKTCDEAIERIRQKMEIEPVFAEIVDRIVYHIKRKTGDETAIGVVVFSNEYGILGENETAKKLRKEFAHEEKSAHLHSGDGSGESRLFDAESKGNH
ncbi:MAG TPA: cobalamin biosynthesis protein CbiD [Eubacteriaceae bacterium]|nr:cobalamin biosynthesis protein CbiD [Eubacteriaceae bacterium]